MQPITDLSLLKHHRVDFSARIDTDGAKRRAFPKNAMSALLLAVVALSMMANYSA